MTHSEEMEAASLTLAEVVDRAYRQDLLDGSMFDFMIVAMKYHNDHPMQIAKILEMNDEDFKAQIEVIKGGVDDARTV